MTRGSVLERDCELAELDAFVRDVGDGLGGTVVVEGQPGLGKSTLLGAAATWARQGQRVAALEFCCGELEQELAWAAARGLVTGAAGDATLLNHALDVDGAREPQVFGAIHALFMLISGLAHRQPLLLLVDDAHWCDRQSLQLLAYLQRRVHALPIGLVVAMRPPATWAESGLLEHLQSAPDTAVLRLGALGVKSVAALVRERAFPDAADAFCETCWQVTAGNPFFLQELLIELRQRGLGPDCPADVLDEIAPPSVQSSVLLRLDRLPAARSPSPATLD
jgi:predicted ATPase